MDKKILIKIFIIFIMFAAFYTNVAKTNAAAHFEDSTVISKGVLIQAYPLKTITSAALNEGDFVYFIVPSDLWGYEVNILPKNTRLRGYVEMLKMPIRGINAAMVIKIKEAIYPDGTIKRMDAVVTHNGSTQIGGDLTPPASYNKTVHPRKGMYWKGAGVLQYVPSGEYEMGNHVTLPTNEALFIMLNEDFDSAQYGISRDKMFQG